MKARMSLNFCQVRQLTMELAVLGHLRHQYIILAPSFLIRSSSFLEVMRTCIKAWVNLNFSQIPPLTTELTAIEHLKNQCHRFLAHLSRRLIGELIGYSWSDVRRTSSVRPQCSKIFFSKTARPIKAKFYVEPPWVGGTKVCSPHLGHMTNMGAMPIYGKNPSKIFSRTGGLIFTKLGM